MNLHYYLDIKVANLLSSFSLNGVPVLQDPAGEGLRTIHPVNDWIRPGDNRLSFLLDWDPDRDFVPGQGTLELQLFIADPNSEFPRPGQVLLQYRWPLPDRPEAYPFRLEQPFRVDNPPPARLWQEAEALPLVSGIDRELIRGLVERFRTALENRDFDEAYRLMAYRFQEQARYRYKDPDRVRAVAIGLYQQMMSEPGITSRPLDPDTTRYTLVADNQLVMVNRGNGDAAVVFENDDEKYSIPVFVARINGAWVIAR